MANKSKTSSASQAASQESPSEESQTLPFEEALKKLEQVVEEMEQQDLPLEKLLTRYEEGIRLARQCQNKLAEAELKIQQLEKNSDSETNLKPLSFDSKETPNE